MNELDVLNGESKALRYTQRSMEEIDKNPPAAPPPELIRELMSKTSKVGRPAFYNTRDEFAERTAEYFTSKQMCVFNEKGDLIGYKWTEKLTMSGLALWLHMSTTTLRNYGKRDEFSDIVEYAKQIVENFNESALFENRNPAGPIFSLKNNFGWSDKNEIVITPNSPLGDRKDRLQIEEYAKELRDNVVD